MLYLNELIFDDGQTLNLETYIHFMIGVITKNWKGQSSAKKTFAIIYIQHITLPIPK